MCTLFRSQKSFSINSLFELSEGQGLATRTRHILENVAAMELFTDAKLEPCVCEFYRKNNSTTAETSSRMVKHFMREPSRTPRSVENI